MQRSDRPSRFSAAGSNVALGASVAMPGVPSSSVPISLAAATLKWRFGHWESLAGLRHSNLDACPDKAMIALLIAGACQQIGEDDAAFELVRRAIYWGCGLQHVSEVLMAGLETTLSCAFLQAGDVDRGKRHYALADSLNSGIAARSFSGKRYGGSGRIGILNSLIRPNDPIGDAFTIPDSGITSYAQNFEDVMLWRALGRVRNGVYIDVGAQDPVVDSISKGFYEKGWRGIHVEPVPAYCESLRRDRPDETVLEAVVSASEGSVVLYEIPDTGISTGVKTIAESHRSHGFNVVPIEVKSIPLADVFSNFEGMEIHWLKIDAEGMEEQVLLSWRDAPARPWIVVVESTLPLTQVENFTAWEPHLTSRGYRPVYFDGLNRFYLASAHMNLERSFKVPPNVFDRFVLRRKSDEQPLIRVPHMELSGGSAR